MGIKKSRQKKIDDTATGILGSLYDHSHVEHLPINGNYPGVDGLIQMVDKESNYSGRHLLYQVKGKEKLKSYTFPCKVSHLQHWAHSNPPVIFILVDNEAKKAYWQKIDAAFVRRLRIRPGQKHKTISIDPNNEISSESNYLSEWYSIAGGDGTLAVDQWTEITNSVEKKVDHFLGVFSLLSPLRNGDTQHIDKIKEILGLDGPFFTVLLYECLKRGLIKSVGDILIINDDKEGVRGLSDFVATLTGAELKSLEKATSDPKKQKVILKRLAEIKDSKAAKVLKDNAQQLLEDLRKNL